MNSPMISIVANFYNSAPFISKLIKSVLKQSVTDWELICVNDCSPGRDSQILHKWATKDERIKVIDLPQNVGISKAKAIGIHEAHGEYLTFIDGDDWIGPDMLAKMLEPAQKYDLDMVVMGYVRVYAFGYKLYSPVGVDKCGVPIYMPEVFDTYFMNFFGANYFSFSYWGKLYKRSLIEESKFEAPEDFVSEDYFFNLNLFPHVKSLMFLQDCDYFWRQGGLSSRRIKDEVWSYDKSLHRIIDGYIICNKIINEKIYLKGKIPLIKFHVNQIVKTISAMLYSNLTEVEIRNILNEILSHPLYDDFIIIENCTVNTSLPLRSFLNRDVDQIIEYCKHHPQLHWKGRIMNKITDFLYGFNFNCLCD